MTPGQSATSYMAQHNWLRDGVAVEQAAAIIDREFVTLNRERDAAIIAATFWKAKADEAMALLDESGKQLDRALGLANRLGEIGAQACELGKTANRT